MKNTIQEIKKLNNFKNRAELLFNEITKYKKEGKDLSNFLIDSILLFQEDFDLYDVIYGMNESVEYYNKCDEVYNYINYTFYELINKGV